MSIEVDFEQAVKRPLMNVPPNETGIGSEEDSMRNVIDPLLPKRRPNKEYFNYLENGDKASACTCSRHAEPATEQLCFFPHFCVLPPSP